MKPIKSMQDQAGIMLLEAIIAILIFSFGILAVVGMQARAVQDMGQAKYRSDASFLANQLVADIWTNAKNVADYKWTSGAPPTAVSTWADQVYASLPGAQDHQPTVEYDAASQEVIVTLYWITPAELSANPKSPPHKFSAVTYINMNS